MKKALVVYSSRYGYTKKYAQWLSASLGCGLMEASTATAADTADCDVLIFGGGLYAGSINGVSFLTKNEEAFADKRLIVFAVGLEAPEASGSDAPILARNFSAALRERVTLFRLRGGIDFARLSLVHRAMMRVMGFVLWRKGDAQRTESDKVILEIMGKSADYCDAVTLRPLVDYTKGLLALDKL